MAVVTLPVMVRRDGVVFISDGAKGVAREASVELAKLGFHVLIGVKSEEEKSSFVFESRKGLELILFDISDPTTLVKVVYRLRQLRRDLDRPVVGVVLNLADFIEDHLAESHFIDIELLDINYKALVKGPLRLMQSMMELVKQQKLEDDERASSRIKDHNRMISSGAAVGIERGGLSTNVTGPVNAQGLRVLTLTLEMPTDTICGSKCVLQNSFVDLIDSLRSDNSSVTNITLSTVHSLYRPHVAASRVKGPSILNKRYRRGGTQAAKEKVYEQQLLAARIKAVERYISEKVSGGSRKLNSDSLHVEAVDEEGRGGDKKHMSYSACAVVHSFASPYPLSHYEEL